MEVGALGGQSVCLKLSQGAVGAQVGLAPIRYRGLAAS
jgi:hypothetical protein